MLNMKLNAAQFGSKSHFSSVFKYHDDVHRHISIEYKIGKIMSIFARQLKDILSVFPAFETRFHDSKYI